MQKRILAAVTALVGLAVVCSYGLGWDLASTLVAVGLTGPVVFGIVLDERLEFADATSVAAAAGTALIGDVIDLTQIGRNLDKLLYLVITTDTEIITGGAAGTLEFQLVSDAQAAIATDGTATVHWRSGNFVTDDAAVNSAFFNAGGLIACVPLPGMGPTYERYLGILAVTGTTTTTAGKINAFLTHDPKQWVAVDNGIAAI